MLQRLLTASLIALVVSGAAPVGVLAAAPVATPQEVATDEDTPVAITLAGTDDDLDPLTFDVVEGPAHGALSGSAPELTYTPDDNYHGTDDFTFTASDGVDHSAPATVSITVDPVNDPPVVADDPGTACLAPTDSGGSFPIPEDWSGGSVGFEGWFALVVGDCAPMLNDTDPDGDELTFELVGQPEHGAATSLPDGFLAYDPDPDYSTRGGDQAGGTWVSDTIHYRVFDGSAYSDTASYRLWIAPVNDAPSFTAGGDVTVAEDSGPYSAQWASAIDPGPYESYQAVDFLVSTSNDDLFTAQPAITADGALTFTPKADWTGSATVTVRAHDDGGLEDYSGVLVSPADTSGPQTFTITVTASNDAPAPAPGSTSTAWGIPWLIPISASDIEGDETTAFALATPPEHGDVTIDPGPYACDGLTPNTCTGSAVYTADSGYSGPDSFTFTASDATDASAPATVTITVTDNAAPACDDASSTGAEEAQQVGSLTCADAENEQLTHSLADGASGGVASVDPDGSWSYTPAEDFHGGDSFTFQATDANGTSNVATMSITVTPVNDAPVCTGAALATGKNVAVEGSIACTDIDGGPLTLRIGSSPSSGSVDPFDTSTGAFTYTPAAGVTGSDSFTVIANDGVVDSEAATVTVDVANNPPACAGAAPPPADEDTGQAGTLACSDPDDDALSYVIDTSPANGTLTLDPGTGAWTYTPDPDWSGGDGFSAHASDGVAASAPVTVALQVAPVNDAPVADATTVTVDEDSTGNPITLTGRDIERSPITFSVTTPPSHGSLEGTAPELTYKPHTDYNGPDSFMFTVSDGVLDAAPATVSITVTDVNDDPVAKNDASGTSSFPYVRATTTSILNVLANDSAGAGDTGPRGVITVTAVGAPLAPSRGTISVAPGGSGVVYDPKGCATGSDVFSYVVTDGAGQTSSAAVVVTIDRPGAHGLSTRPITNTPGAGLRSGGTLGSAGIPVRVTWCGVTKAGASLKGYRIGQSSNGGATWGTLVASSTRSTSATRGLKAGRTYRWRVRTTDSGGRTGAYQVSGTAKASIIQDTPGASVVYAGGWRVKSTSKASGGRMRYASSTAASATISVPAGTRQFGIVAPKGSGYGSVKVWVDGTYAGSFKERASSSSFKRILLVRSVNPATAHTVVLKPAGNGRVYLDAIVTLR